MGCGCGGGMRGVSRRPVISPRQSVIRTAAPRGAVQAQSVKSQSVQAQTNQVLSSDKRAIEKQRRETILRKLGRL
jgi:hypothetical protein